MGPEMNFPPILLFICDSSSQNGWYCPLRKWNYQRGWKKQGDSRGGHWMWDLCFLHLSHRSSSSGIQLPTFNVSSGVKYLEVILDNTLSMETRVSVTARSAFYHLQLIRQMVSYLTSWNLGKLSHAMVTSRLNYYNSLWVGLLLGLIWKLQLGQDVVAWLETALSSWLCIQYQLYQLLISDLRYW